MASLEYSISELHTLLELHIRNSMSLNNRSDLHDIAVQNKNYILQQGNPVYNKLYKNMKLSTLTDHINQSGSNVKKLWDIEDHNYDYIIDDGQIEEKNMLSSMSYNKPRVLNPYSNSRIFAYIYNNSYTIKIFVIIIITIAYCCIYYRS